MLFFEGCVLWNEAWLFLTYCVASGELLTQLALENKLWSLWSTEIKLACNRAGNRQTLKYIITYFRIGFSLYPFLWTVKLTVITLPISPRLLHLSKNTLHTLNLAKNTASQKYFSHQTYLRKIICQAIWKENVVLENFLLFETPCSKIVRHIGIWTSRFEKCLDTATENV